MMKIAHTLNNTFDTIKFFVKEKYFDWGQKLATKHVLPLMSNFMRELIIFKGKDPDYIPTPPLPEFESLSNRDKQLSIPLVPSWVSASFEDPNNHPILKLRKGSEEKPAEVLRVARAPETKKGSSLKTKEGRQALREKVLQALQDEAYEFHTKKKIAVFDPITDLKLAVEAIEKDFVPTTKVKLKGSFKRVRAKEE